MKNKIFPHSFWRPFLDCMPQLFFQPKYVWFPVHLKGPEIPDPSSQLAELIVDITSTTVDLYSRQILFTQHYRGSTLVWIYAHITFHMGKIILSHGMVRDNFNLCGIVIIRGT